MKILRTKIFFHETSTQLKRKCIAVDLFGEQCNGMGWKVLLAEAITRVDKMKFVDIMDLRI